jgi:hypothetical protein
MPRDIDSTLLAALTSGLIRPVFLAELTFRTTTQYVWSGVGTISFGGNNFVGVGSLGEIGAVQEGVDVSADGTTVTLSGIDPVLLGECMTDVQTGAPAKLWFGVVDTNMALVGTPYLLFSGTVDVPTHTANGETISISLTLENGMTDLGRATSTRYTQADQRRLYPTDTAFNWVEQQNDLALVWGS